MGSANCWRAHAGCFADIARTRSSVADSERGIRGAILFSCSAALGWPLKGTSSSIAARVSAINPDIEVFPATDGDPTALVCDVVLAEAHLEATLGVSADIDDDFIGFMWGVQTTSRFYALIWKRAEQDFQDCTAQAGVVIKRFDKVEDYDLAQDFLCTQSSANQAMLMDPSQTLAAGWEPTHE